MLQEFTQCLESKQKLDVHQRLIESRIKTTLHKPENEKWGLHDFYAESSLGKVWWECKTDSHRFSQNLAIELISNTALPPALRRWGSVPIHPEDGIYSLAMDAIRSSEPEKLGVGLDKANAEAWHVLSYLFHETRHLLYPLHRLQDFVYQILPERKYSMCIGYSHSWGRYWQSLNLLVPVEDVEEMRVKP